MIENISWLGHASFKIEGDKVVCTMHYGEIRCSRADVEKFKRLCSCEVRILEPER